MDQELTLYSHTYFNTLSFILCPYWLSVGDTRSAMNFLNDLHCKNGCVILTLV